MKQILISLLIILSVQIVSAMEGEELPNDPVLSLTAQEQLFVQAYEKFNPIDINPKTTPISDLEPMVRMHYSYVSQLVRESVEHLNLLKQFWQKTAGIIRNNQLTIARMRSLTMQLALLLTDMEKGKLSEDRKDEHHYILYHSNLWKDIQNYNDQDFYIPSRQNFPAHPFYCEAILCYKKGGFANKRFVDTYLERPFVMHLAALALRNKGPHGGLVAESADFLQHDFGHNEILALYSEFNQKILSENPQTKHLNYWKIIRSLLKKVREAQRNLQLNDMALSFMLHEAVPSVIGDESISLLELPEEEMTLPVSQRRLFLGAVADSASFTQMRNFNNDALRDAAFQIPSENNKLQINHDITISHVPETIKENSNGTFTGTLRMTRFLQPLSLSEGSGLYERIDVGTFSIIYEILSTDDPLKEKVRVLKACDINWAKTVQFNVSRDEQQMIADILNEWSYTVLVDSQLRTYLFSMKDNENMLRSFYKEDCHLPPADAPLPELALAVNKKMKQFWREFYLINKDLFSDKRL